MSEYELRQLYNHYGEYREACKKLAISEVDKYLKGEISIPETPTCNFTTRWSLKA